MLTTLLAMSMVARRRLGFSINVTINADLLSFFCFSSSSCLGLREKNAISDPDTMADMISKTSIDKSPIAASVLNVLNNVSITDK